MHKNLAKSWKQQCIQRMEKKWESVSAQLQQHRQMIRYASMVKGKHISLAKVIWCWCAFLDFCTPIPLICAYDVHVSSKAGATPDHYLHSFITLCLSLWTYPSLSSYKLFMLSATTTDLWDGTEIQFNLLYIEKHCNWAFHHVETC